MAGCLTTPQPFGPKGRPQPHQRPDGTYTQHDYDYWGIDVRHQFPGHYADSHIYVCKRCGRDKQVEIKG